MRKWFPDTSIATRLGVGFSVLVFLITAFGLFVLYQMAELKKQSDILYRHPFTVSRAIDALAIEIVKIHREMKDLAHTTAPDQVRTHQSRISVHDANALSHLETVRVQFLGDPQAVKRVYQSLID